MLDDTWVAGVAQVAGRCVTGVTGVGCSAVLREGEPEGLTGQVVAGDGLEADRGDGLVEDAVSPDQLDGLAVGRRPVSTTSRRSGGRVWRAIASRVSVSKGPWSRSSRTAVTVAVGAGLP